MSSPLATFLTSVGVAALKWARLGDVESRNVNVVEASACSLPTER